MYLRQGVSVEKEYSIVGITHNSISTVLNGVDHTHSAYVLCKDNLHKLNFTRY